LRSFRAAVMSAANCPYRSLVAAVSMVVAARRGKLSWPETLWPSSIWAPGRPAARISPAFSSWEWFLWQNLPTTATLEKPFSLIWVAASLI